MLKRDGKTDPGIQQQIVVLEIVYVAQEVSPFETHSLA